MIGQKPSSAEQRCELYRLSIDSRLENKDFICQWLSAREGWVDQSKAGMYVHRLDKPYQRDCTQPCAHKALLYLSGASNVGALLNKTPCLCVELSVARAAFLATHSKRNQP